MGDGGGGGGSSGGGFSSGAGITNGLSKVPAVVEVVVGDGVGGDGGVRMKYPSCHVLVPSKSENPLDCIGGAIPRVVSVQRAPTPAAAVSAVASAAASSAAAVTAPPTPESNVTSSSKILQQQPQNNFNQSLTLTPPTSPADQLLSGRMNHGAAIAAKSSTADVAGKKVFFLL